MIGNICVRINAANPMLALPPLRAYAGSPSSVTIEGAPGGIGEWKLTDVYLTVEYRDGTSVTAKCVRTGCVWTGTVEGAAAEGPGLYSVTADGVDENGHPV